MIVIKGGTMSFVWNSLSFCLFVWWVGATNTEIQKYKTKNTNTEIQNTNTDMQKTKYKNTRTQIPIHLSGSFCVLVWWVCTTQRNSQSERRTCIEDFYIFETHFLLFKKNSLSGWKQTVFSNLIQDKNLLSNLKGIGFGNFMWTIIRIFVKVQGDFFHWYPPKSSKYKKVNLG